MMNLPISKNATRYCITIIAIFSFLLSYISTSINVHYHIDKNGKQVVHSHFTYPDNTSETEPKGPARHQHSNQEYFLFSSLADFENNLNVDTNFSIYKQTPVLHTIALSFIYSSINVSFLLGERAPPHLS